MAKVRELMLSRWANQVCAIVLDLMMLPLAVITFTLYMLGIYSLLFACQRRWCTRPCSATEQPMQIPILLLHGSGYNESEWLIGQLWLQQSSSSPQRVYTLNYAGYFGNRKQDGVASYALGPVREKVRQIQAETGALEVKLVGHSLGGLIASYYAEYVAEIDGVQVPLVITIGTPWRGTPRVDQLFVAATRPQRYTDMAPGSALLVDLLFRIEISISGVDKRTTTSRRYVCIGSPDDLFVPGQCWKLPDSYPWVQTHAISGLGHYSLIASPSVWRIVCNYV